MSNYHSIMSNVSSSDLSDTLSSQEDISLSPTSSILESKDPPLSSSLDINALPIDLTVEDSILNVSNTNVNVNVNNSSSQLSYLGKSPRETNLNNKTSQINKAYSLKSTVHKAGAIIGTATILGCCVGLSSIGLGAICGVIALGFFSNGALGFYGGDIFAVEDSEKSRKKNNTGRKDDNVPENTDVKERLVMPKLIHKLSDNEEDISDIHYHTESSATNINSNNNINSSLFFCINNISIKYCTENNNTTHTFESKDESSNITPISIEIMRNDLTNHIKGLPSQLNNIFNHLDAEHQRIKCVKADLGEGKLAYIYGFASDIKVGDERHSEWLPPSTMKENMNSELRAQSRVGWKQGNTEFRTKLSLAREKAEPGTVPVAVTDGVHNKPQSAGKKAEVNTWTWRSHNGVTNERYSGLPLPKIDDEGDLELRTKLSLAREKAEPGTVPVAVTDGVHNKPQSADKKAEVNTWTWRSHNGVTNERYSGLPSPKIDDEGDLELRTKLSLAREKAEPGTVPVAVTDGVHNKPQSADKKAEVNTWTWRSHNGVTNERYSGLPSPKIDDEGDLELRTKLSLAREKAEPGTVPVAVTDGVHNKPQSADKKAEVNTWTWRSHNGVTNERYSGLPLPKIDDEGDLELRTKLSLAREKAEPGTVPVAVTDGVHNKPQSADKKAEVNTWTWRSHNGVTNERYSGLPSPKIDDEGDLELRTKLSLARKKAEPGT